MEIYPSLISSDLLWLGKTLTFLDGHCHGYHIDIMDNHFVPNLTWGPAFIDALSKGTNKPLHLHCMVDNPLSLIDQLKSRPGDVFIFHYEAASSEVDCIIIIKKACVAGFKVGMAINPATPVEVVYPYLTLLDTVLIMSVNPGFSGQSFLPGVLSKAEALVAESACKNQRLAVGMDGGINKSNIRLVEASGVTQVGVAAAIFSATDPIEAITELYRCCVK